MSENNVGRPSEYTEEKADIICARITEGQSIRTICADEDMPAVETFYRWLRQNPAFQEQYARAKEQQADALAEEILDICDDGSNDWIEKNDKENSGYAYNGEAVQRSRLRVDTRKWLAGKLRPKKYGDATTVKNQQLDKEGDATDPVDAGLIADRVTAALQKTQTASCNREEEKGAVPKENNQSGVE